jgi:hypothetical protein
MGVHQVSTDLKKVYDPVRREFGIPMNLVRLNKMCLSETCSKVHIGKHLSDSFPIQCDLNKEMLYRECFSTLH